MADIIRGTTPTIKIKFKSVSVADIVIAYLTIRSRGEILVEKELDTAAVNPSENSLTWRLEQEDTLSLPVANVPVTVLCDWMTSGRVRGRSRQVICRVGDTGKNEIFRWDAAN